MQSFDKWFTQTTKEIGLKQKPQNIVPDILMDEGSEEPGAEGGWTFPCRSCGGYAPIICEPSEFDPINHVCGGSPRCTL